MTDNKKQKFKYGDRWFYTFIKPLLIFLIYLLYPPKVIGRENIPKEGPIVFAGNHAKWVDPEIVCAVVKKRQVHFLAKQELFKGISSIVTWGMGAIPVNRKIHDHDALEYAIEALNRGLCIGIFPEGTINKTDDTIMPFKIGAVKMAEKTDATIVPFTISGSYKIFRGATIEFLKPMKVEGTLDEANEKLMNVIRKNLEKGEKENGSKNRKSNSL